MPRVILSRKGFDASAGGAPSPILPDGTLLSLPIPEPGTGARYADLAAPDGRSLMEVMVEAGVTTVRSAGGTVPLSRRLEAHLDPDLCAAARPRPAGWRGAFGQAGAAQTILARAGVGVGDLFLFFGWFRATPAAGPLVAVPHRDVHVIWGWLRVGAVVSPDDAPPFLRDHPHVVRPDRRNNTIYIAADHAFAGVAGAGVLPFHPARMLTAGDATGRADWLLPQCLHPSAARVLPRHARRFGPVVNGFARFDARWQWQEFVADAGPALNDWAEAMVRGDGPQP